MRKHLMIGFFGLLGASGLGAAIATQTINYQGQLTDQFNAAVNGTANLSFVLYTAATGPGTPTGWSYAQNNVPINQGLFEVQLPISTLASSFLNGNLWLEVTVNGQVMSPRKQVLAAMFSANANLLQGLAPDNTPNNIPVLDATGKLLPSVVSAPFPLLASGAGAGYAIYGQNSNLAAGQSGLVGSGFNGLSATAAAAAGMGIIGQTGPSDLATAAGVYGHANSGIGVQGVASSGVGVRADSSSGSNPALLVNNASGLGASVSAINGLSVNSSGTGISVVNSGGNYGINVSNNSSLAASRGLNPSANGVGVSGENTQASSGAAGFGIGSYGSSNSSNGSGVKGEAVSSSGNNFGVYGDTASSGGVGVFGLGIMRGVQGQSSAVSSTAIYGLGQGSPSTGVTGESSGSGLAYGVHGLVASPQGAGVFGEGPGYGVFGNSNGSGATAYGVYGLAQAEGVVGDSAAVSGGAWGVLGRAQSAAGNGVEGDANGSGTGVRAGVMGLAPGLGGQSYGVYGSGANVGVYGQAAGSGGSAYGINGFVGGSGDNRFGVYGTVAANPGEQVYAVFGELTDANNSGYALVGSNESSSGKAVFASNQAAQFSTDAGYALGVDGKFKVFDDNAGTFAELAAASQTSWFVPSDYCGAGDSVLVTPLFDLNLDPTGAAQSNALWVESVVDGGFTVRTDKPVKGVAGNFEINYLVIAK
jgi:hypothetical protein